MAIAFHFPGFMTVAEFLKWDSPEGYLWQLVDGEPVAIAPPVPLHGRIHGEAARLIGNHLVERDSPCGVVLTPSVIPRFLPEGNFRVPDLAVTCSAADVTGTAVHEPVLLIEILSPSNRAETWRNV